MDQMDGSLAIVDCQRKLPGYLYIYLDINLGYSDVLFFHFLSVISLLFLFLVGLSSYSFPPSSLSIVVTRAAFALWTPYHPDIKAIMEGLWNLFAYNGTYV